MTYRIGYRGHASVALIAVVLLGCALLLVRKSPSRVDPSIDVVEVRTGPGVVVRPELPTSRSGGESFGEMIERLRPRAAINGTFYDEKMRPLGDILIDGKLANRGHYRNGVGITRDGRIAFLRSRSGRIDWSGYRHGIASGPRLVHDGKVDLDPVSEGFSRRSLTLTAPRSGIGITRSRTLLLVTVSKRVTLSQFAETMRSLGAVEAVNLDGGGACALYSQKKMLSVPVLPMANIIAVYDRQKR